MRFAKLMTATLFAMAVAAIPAQADDDKDRGRASMRGMDTNGDGVITRREWRGNNTSFRNHDLNNDGILTAREMGVTNRGQVARQGRSNAANLTREQYFRMLDENRDGVLSHWEWDDVNISHAAADFNRDGVVGWQEWVETRQGNREGRLSADQYRYDPYRDDDRRVIDDERLNDFLRDDRNNDEYLSRSEWRGTEWSFQHHDRNNDGRVHISEFLQG